ncbi:MAG: PAS domain S-box protein [Anaerolineae bacterium]|jgi:PAS domain S-box-containing protein
MKANSLEQELRAANRHLETLRQRIGTLDPQDGGVAAALGALSASLERLQAAGDALCQESTAAKAERQRYRAMFQKAPSGYLVTDREGVILEANLAAADLLHSSPEALIGTSLSNLLDADATEPTFHEQVERLRQAPAEVWEIRLQPQEGNPFPAALWATPIHDGAGHLVALRWLIRDVTERRQIETERTELLTQVQQERQRAEEQAAETQLANNLLHALIYTMPTGVIVSDGDGTLLMTNPAAREILGSVPFGSVYHPKHDHTVHRPDGSPFPLAEMPLRRAIEHGETTDHVEILIRRSDGEQRFVLAGGAPVRDVNGNTTVGVATFQDITARKRAEQEREKLLAQAEKERQTAERLARTLERERDMLEAIMENTSTHLAYLDPDFNFVRVNSAYAAGAGYTKEELVGRSHFELFPHAENQAIFERVRDTGKPITFHARPFRHPSRPEAGETYWDWTLAPVEDRDGRIQGLVFSLTDVTDREQTRRALHQYANRLEILHQTDQAILSARSVDEVAGAALYHIRQLVDSPRVSGVVFDTDEETVTVIAVDVDGDTALDRGWQGNLSAPWSVEELRRGRIRIIEDLQSLSPTSAAVQILQKEGIRTFVNVPLIARGQLIGAFNIALANPDELTPERIDIVREVADQLALSIQQARLHEQVRQHADELEKRVARRTAALEASEARFRAIFEQAAIGIALLDSENHIIASNAALQQMLGYTEKELNGIHFPSLMHPDDASAEEHLFDQVKDEENGFYKAERRYVRQDGQSIWANLIVSLVQQPGGRPRFAIAMVEDITQQRKARAAMIQSEKLALTGQLAASLAHEINNPLQSVIGCLGLARETLSDCGEANEFLQVAHQELRRAARIVAQLRDLNRASRPEDREAGDLSQLMDRVLILSKNRVESAGVTVEWEGADDLPPVRVVPDRMQQVFLNLVLNSTDAMPGGGRLKIDMTQTQDPAGVEIVLTDTGEGIPSQVLPHIFDPFYSTKPDGLGLGLFVTQNIVEEHHGWIDVESKSGKGTTFTVWLPTQ